MKHVYSNLLKTLLGTSCLLLSFSSMAKPEHWGYKGESGPEHWAELTPEYGACSGKNQSPINLSHFVSAELDDIKFEYAPGGSQIVNNGHAIQINYNQGSDIILDGKKFNLVQFHFHAPSENNIDGKSYPMEGHFVHADKQGNLAVVAVMFDYGDENLALDELWQTMPQHAGDKQKLSHLFNAKQLLPASKHYFRYNGSLTTPPCSEGVRWIVMKEPLSVSKQQVSDFRHTLAVKNNRPLQPLNSRVVLQ